MQNFCIGQEWFPDVFQGFVTVFLTSHQNLQALILKICVHRPECFLYWEKDRKTITIKKRFLQRGHKKKLISSAQKELSCNSPVDLHIATNKTIPNSPPVDAAFLSMKNESPHYQQKRKKKKATRENSIPVVLMLFCIFNNKKSSKSQKVTFESHM